MPFQAEALVKVHEAVALARAELDEIASGADLKDMRAITVRLKELAEQVATYRIINCMPKLG